MPHGRGTAPIFVRVSDRVVEQQYFKDSFSKLNINVNVLGTEISSTATNYPNTIEWDFHDVKEEWVSNVDIVYSNSIDHSYKPHDLS